MIESEEKNVFLKKYPKLPKHLRVCFLLMLLVDVGISEECGQKE